MQWWWLLSAFAPKHVQLTTHNALLMRRSNRTACYPLHRKTVTSLFLEEATSRAKNVMQQGVKTDTSLGCSPPNPSLHSLTPFVCAAWNGYPFCLRQKTRGLGKTKQKRSQNGPSSTHFQAETDGFSIERETIYWHWDKNQASARCMFFFLCVWLWWTAATLVACALRWFPFFLSRIQLYSKEHIANLLPFKTWARS